MADAAAAEIEAADPAGQPAAAEKSAGKAADKSKKKREKPDDAVKLGCGGLFRRKKKAAKAGAENGGGGGADGGAHPAASKAPIEKPPPPAAAKPAEKGSPVKGTVKTDAETPAAAPQPAAAVAPANDDNDPVVTPDHVPKLEKPSARPPIVQLKQPTHGDDGPHSVHAVTDDKHAVTDDKHAVTADKHAVTDDKHTVTDDKHDITDVTDDKHAVTDVTEDDSAVTDESPDFAVTGVVMEDSPQCQMWSNIVANSMVGTGIFKRAAACSLATGGVLACAPAEFTPNVEQVAALRDNFANRQVFSAAGFGVADTIYSLQDESATPEILAGVDRGQTEGVLVTLCNTVAIIGTFTEKPDVARETLSALRSNFVEQGL